MEYLESESVKNGVKEPIHKAEQMTFIAFMQ